MTSAVLTTTDEMTDLARRLVAEHADLRAAWVLRCLTRSFHRAQSWGCPPEHLLVTVEASTRWGLAQTPSDWASCER